MGREPVMQLADGGDHVHDRRRGGVPEIGVAGIECERDTLFIQVEAVEAILLNNRPGRRNEVLDILSGIQRQHVCVGNTDQNLFPLALDRLDICFEFFGGLFRRQSEIDCRRRVLLWGANSTLMTSYWGATSTSRIKPSGSIQS